MQYYRGDKVRIRPDIYVGMQSTFGVTRNMVNMAGEIVTISGYTEGAYYIEEDPRGYKWEPQLFSKIDSVHDTGYIIFHGEKINLVNR